MGTEYVWLRREFPWLGDGFIHAVAEEYADLFVGAITDLGFTVATMRPRTPLEFHDELAAALNFPSYYGKNWDAAHDCFRGLVVGHPFALVWRNADRIAASDPKLFAEAAAILSTEFDTLGQRNIQAVLVITGTGNSFARPAESTREAAG